MPAEILLDAELGLPDSVARHIELAYEAAFSTGVDATAEVCIRVCDAAASRSLNQSFRQQDKPTNVLSFPADLSVEGVAILGDIALCWPIIEQEAAQQHKQVMDHLAHLTIHGLLHLSGHDHQHPAEAEIMENLERQALTGLGIADPYR